MMTQVLATTALFIWLFFLIFKWIKYFVDEESSGTVMLTILWWAALFIYGSIYG